MVDPEVLRAFFVERGWVIHLPARVGQPLDPFVELAEHLGRSSTAGGVDLVAALRSFERDLTVGSGQASFRGVVILADAEQAAVLLGAIP